MPMLEVIKTRIVFVFELVDWGRCKIHRLRPPKVKGVQAVQGLLKMLIWTTRLAFACWKRSKSAVMVQVKPAKRSPGYGQQTLELQMTTTRRMTFCDLSGRRVGLVQIGARRRFYFSERRCVECWFSWSGKVIGGCSVRNFGKGCHLDEGLRAFARGQADLQQRLAVQFQETWKGPLHTEDSTNPTNENDDPEDDGEDDDNNNEHDNNNILEDDEEEENID
jgi:hypothetical protein